MSRLSPLDRLITQVDTFIKTTTGSIGPRDRPSPAETMREVELSAEERTYSARLMRINHCGEVCAQALYHGQALTARDTQTSAVMQQAAAEERDHLSWCEQRIKELDSHVSLLNPFWYAASFSMGALAGLLGDKINLGFIAATEQEVCRHLDEHLEKLPPGDEKSRSILRQMRDDESRHATTAIEHGGSHYPEPIKSIMRQVSRLMTRSTYWV
ncbi:MAG: 2-polyprenyl-3-methyl-6-methoxy-1,4-benzoquinone monooxygenase [Proteobacteria bacterium]|nr:2-polyprenyl-3-methyl-6-methoxy-1,4-benzoquinone monooxygenase [Pseudomonadota bacterium]